MASVSGIKGKKNPTLLLAELLQIEGEMAVMQYDTGATASLVFSNFIRKLNLFSRPKRVQISITSGIDGGPEEATLMHELYIKWPRGRAHSGQFLEVEKIRRLPRPPAEEVLDVIFPHPDRQEWVADWGLTGGEVDILLGADMIHLFPNLDYTVEKLSLYMSFLTEWYIVMGQMPDNAPEEQLEVIRRFSEEHGGGRLRSTTTSRPRGAGMQPRRPASLEVTVRGPDRREVMYAASPAVSGTTRRSATTAQPNSTTTVNHRHVAPPTDVPVTSVRRPPPSQRPPRPARTGPPHWAIPLATSKHTVKRKKPPVVILPPRPPRGQRRMEMRPRDLGDLVTLRYRLSWSFPAVLGILLFILGLLTGRSHGFPAYDCHNWSNHVEVFSLLEPASCHAASTDLRVERMLPAEIIQIRKTRTIPALHCLAVVTEVSQYCGHSSAAGVMRFLKFRETATVESQSCRDAFDNKGKIEVGG